MKLHQTVLKHIFKIIPGGTAFAHCDIPCGIYDPHQAQVAVLTIIRMTDIITELEHGHEKHDEEFSNSFMRAVATKEDHGKIVKHEINTIWGDYFKKEHRDKFPEIDSLVHEIMQLASRAKQTVNRDNGIKLLEKVNRFAQIFWETKGKETKKVKAPYKPEEEIVVPIL